MNPLRRRATLALLLLPAALAVSGPAVAQTFENPASISIPSGTAPTPAATYPSLITVSGLTQPVGRIRVVIDGFAHANPDNVDMLLVSPTGRPFELWSDVGGTSATGAVTILIDDQASAALPDAGPLADGSFRPADYLPATTDVYPSPAPAGPYNPPAPTGGATLNGTYSGLSTAQANGVWSLYVVNDASGNAGVITDGWRIQIFQQPPPGTFLITEYRARGADGANDEYVEVYNNSGFDYTVASGLGTGFGIVASDGVLRCTIPNGTTFPRQGRFLCVNSGGYSLGSHPAGNGTAATGDATFTTNIPDNAGVALFNNNLGGSTYTLANRLDAVGTTAEANALYREGAGLPSLTAFSVNYAWVRDDCGKGGSVTALGPCTRMLPGDTDNNAADFYFVDTNGTSAGAGQRLGAPEPQNMTSPLLLGPNIFARTLLDECVGLSAPPNQIRDLTSNPGQNSTFGTIDLRRRFTNNSGANITRLRFRVVDLSTFPAPSGTADLRPRTSPSVVATVDRAPCGSGTSNVTVQGTTLETPPSQPNGGGFNSTFSVGTITLATPLPNGATIDVRFLFGMQATGTVKIGLIAESLPGGGNMWYGEGVDGISTEYVVTAAEGGPIPVLEAGAAYALGPARPNPTTGGARLDLVVDRAQHVTAELVDTLGRRLAVLHDGPVVTAQTLTVDGSALPTGVYLVRVRGEHFTATRPLTIAR